MNVRSLFPRILSYPSDERRRLVACARGVDSAESITDMPIYVLWGLCAELHIICIIPVCGYVLECLLFVMCRTAHNPNLLVFHDMPGSFMWLCAELHIICIIPFSALYYDMFISGYVQ